MKTIVLSEQAVIDNKLYRKGEVVQVPDSFSKNVKLVISTPMQMASVEKATRAKIISLTKPIEIVEEKPIVKEKDVLTK